MQGNPKPLKEIILEFCKNYGYFDEIIKKKIIETWESINDKIILRNTKIIKYENKVLSIKTSSPSWRVELLSRKETLIELINKEIGDKVVNKLIIR